MSELEVRVVALEIASKLDLGTDVSTLHAARNFYKFLTGDKDDEQVH